jgi:nucleoside-diphosphate-sugar epimerase
MGNANTTVVVTGGSGYVGTHVIEQLLDQGYTVVATVRSDEAASRVRDALAERTIDRLTFVFAELTADEGWDEAMSGATYVVHTASPFPPAQPENADELIIPARDGALRVLAAAERAGVRRVVLTSSFAAVGYSRNNLEVPFTESDWTDASGPHTPYVKSKTIAERAAWDYVANPDVALELSVINPVAIIGPVHGRDFASSIGMVLMLTTGMMPGNPKLSFGIVDVRDVADLHIRAMTNPKAAGERFLAVSKSPVWVHDMAKSLRRLTPEFATKVPKRKLPSWMVRMAAKRQPALASFTSELGKAKQISNDKATQLLGWQPRSVEESLEATVRSLADVGVISPS